MVPTDIKTLYEQVDTPASSMKRESDELFLKELIPPLIFSLAFEVDIEGGVSDLVAIREELMIATTDGRDEFKCSYPLSRFTWRNIANYVDKIVRGCEKCYPFLVKKAWVLLSKICIHFIQNYIFRELLFPTELNRVPGYFGSRGTGKRSETTPSTSAGFPSASTNRDLISLSKVSPPQRKVVFAHRTRFFYGK